MDNPKYVTLLDIETDTEVIYNNNISPKFIKVYVNSILNKPFNEVRHLLNNNFVDLYIQDKFLQHDISDLIDVLTSMSKQLEIKVFKSEEVESSKPIEHFKGDFEIFDTSIKWLENTQYDKEVQEILIQKLQKYAKS
jgi:hypothetical protein